MPQARAYRPLVATCMAAVCLPLCAQTAPSADRPWYVSLAQRVEHRTNAFSAPDGLEVSDTIWTTTVGGGLNARFGRQRAYANASVSASRYQDTDGLDSPAYSFGLGLDWQTINNLSGNLTANATRRQADFNTGISTVTLKNNETSDELGARVLWGGVGLLGVEGTLGWRRVGFSAPEFASREYEQNSGSLGVVYRPSSLLTLGAGVSAQYSDYDVPAFGQFVPDSNERRDLYVQANWQASGASTVAARLNFGKTDYIRANAEDFSGVTGMVNWQWRPTGRTSVTTSLSRDTGQESGFQRTTTGQRTRLTATDFSRVTNIAQVAVNYELTGKVMLTGSASHARRSLVDSLTNGRGSDNTTLTSLGVRWAATRIISVGCDVGHESRSASGFGSYDYSGSTFGCLGQITLD